MRMWDFFYFFSLSLMRKEKIRRGRLSLVSNPMNLPSVLRKQERTRRDFKVQNLPSRSLRAAKLTKRAMTTLPTFFFPSYTSRVILFWFFLTPATDTNNLQKKLKKAAFLNPLGATPVLVAVMQLLLFRVELFYFLVSMDESKCVKCS